MRARLIVALDGDVMPEDQKHLRDHTVMQKAEIIGDDSPTWEAARASAVAKIPAGGLILCTYRDE